MLYTCIPYTIANKLTMFPVPGVVSNILMTADTDVETIFKWNQPVVNPNCVVLYSLCYRLDGETSNPCVEVS